LSGIALDNAGLGYGTAPLVTITGGSGTGAKAVTTVANGVVTGITITDKGFGYTSLPTVILGQPGGIPATGTATSGIVNAGGGRFVGGILSIAVDTPGAGYRVAPAVSITDSTGFGTGASATAIINSAGQVTGFTINSPGIFYIQPVVTLTDPAQVAEATANLTNGKISSYTITSPGAGYSSSPTVYLQTRADPYNLDIDKLLLAADRFSILSGEPSSLVVTAATAVVAPYTNQHPVNLGTDVVGSTSFMSTDLQRFAVNDLVLGRRQATQPSVGAGVITISTAVTASSLRIANGIALAGTRQIKDLGGTTGLAFNSVVLDAGAQVSLTGTGNQIHYFAGTIRDSGMSENATFTLSSSLVASGTSKLPLTIGEVFLDAAFGTGQRFYQGITTQNGDIRVLADQMQQTRVVGFLDTTGGGKYGSGGSLGANTAQVTLAPLTAGTGINLYATAPSSSSVLGLRIGNPQALGLELVEAKGLVIGSGSLRDIQVTNGGFGYQAPPRVIISGGGGSGASGVSILSDTGYLVNGVTYYQVVGVRITNPGTGYTSAPTIAIEGSTVAAFSTSKAVATATIGAAGAITLNSNIEFNYLQYPNAPYQVTLASGSTGSITAGTSQARGGGTSRVTMGALTLFNAGAVSLGGSNDVDTLSAILTGSGTASNLTFNDIDGIQFGKITVPGTLTITAGGAITQTADGVTVGGTASFTTGAALITLNNSNNSFGGAVTLSNTGANNVQITSSGALILGTLTIGQNLTAFSTGALNLGAGTIGGTLTATSNGGAITQTGALTVSGVGTSTITAGAAAITLANAANNFVGTVVLGNSGSANGITLVDGTLNLTIGNITSAGSVSITATGAGGTLLFNGTYGGLTGSLSATAESSGGSTALTISSAMPNITSATLKTDGVFTLGAGADLGNNPGVPSATTTSSISLMSDSSLANNLGARLTAQAITLASYTDTLSLGLNYKNDISLTPGVYNVPYFILNGLGQKIFAKNTLTLGSATGIGGITIGNAGAVDLSSKTYGLVLKGLEGGVTFYNTLSLASGTSFDLSVGKSSVISETETDLVIGGTAGSVSFGSATNVGSSINSFTADVANIGTSALTGSLYYTSTYAGDLTVGQISVAGTSSFVIPTARSFIAANGNNAFAGTVTLGSAGSIENVTINNSRALTLADLSITGDFSSTVTSGALTLGRTVVGNAAGDDFTATAVGISGGPLVVSGSTTLRAGTGDISLTGANDFGTSISVVSSKNTSLYVPGDDLDVLGTTAANPSGTVVATGTFDLRTDAGPLTLPTPTEGDSQLSSRQISNFQVGDLSLTAASILMPYAFNFSNISRLNLTSTVGSIVATGAISLFTLTLSSATSAILTGGNRITNLGSVRTAAGNFTFVNAQGLNLAGMVSVAGTADLTVAGQFYNTTGQALPFARTTGRAVVRSLSMMGGLPKKISALVGFKNSYNFTDPGTSRAMIYAVSPLAQFAPSGTTIAGVDLSGTQTGGGQFNTFLTGSDNLNWMISDFGRFVMPTVKPSGMDYILYPQRVEPETRTLPAATLGNLERELGRPPTLDEIQAREVAVREAAMVRSRGILERSSFDPAIEDETDKQESAEVPVEVIDGGKPQADAGGQKAEDGVQKAEVGSRPSFAPSPASAGGASEGFGPQATKSQSVKQGASGPILRSGPMRSVAELRPAEPAEGSSAGKTATQAVRLDAKSVIEQERASAEVGIAPPIAAGR
jgi:hypothetical protein